ncbi:MAG: putative MOSC domain, partial [Parcubacteria group bacterium Gr01-1014_33]
MGDFHAGEKRISRRTGEPKWNDRQVSIVGKETLDYLNERLSLSLKPGDLAENITTEGLGDLSNLHEGHIFVVGGAVFSVTEQNDPCVNLAVYHRLLVEESYRKRGIVGIVERGVGVTLKPGMAIDLIDKKEVLLRANKIVAPYDLRVEFLEGSYSVGVQG